MTGESLIPDLPENQIRRVAGTTISATAPVVLFHYSMHYCPSWSGLGRVRLYKNQIDLYHANEAASSHGP
jgi:hypothetical protein